MDILEFFKNAREEEATAYKKNAERYILEYEQTMRNNLTATRWEQFKNGEITLEQAQTFAIARRSKQLDKSAKEDIERLESIFACDDVVAVSVSIVWKKSRTWGYNPTATVTAEYKNGGTFTATGTASGCGYDKRSAATASAFNSINGLRKAICELKYNNNANGIKNPYGMNADISAIPHFEGGVGFECHENILNKCGFKTICRNCTDSTDFYYFER